MAYERYLADGRFEFRLPLTAYQGCYSVNENALAFTQPRASTATFKLNGNVLRLHEDGKDSLYDRKDPWYPRDAPGGAKSE